MASEYAMCIAPRGEHPRALMGAGARCVGVDFINFETWLLSCNTLTVT
jgi:hypothetical protein